MAGETGGAVDGWWGLKGEGGDRTFALAEAIGRSIADDEPALVVSIRRLGVPGRWPTAAGLFSAKPAGTRGTGGAERLVLDRRASSRSTSEEKRTWPGLS